MRDLLRDSARSDMLFHEHNKVLADFSRQRVTDKTLEASAPTLGTSPPPPAAPRRNFKI